MTDQDQMTIGEVINLLREEFPDVSVSKVRFLESQGLLAPGRSDGGYRQFDQRDIDRLRYVLRQQRDHFLPLKVIKSKLTLWERGEIVDEDAPAGERTFLEPQSEPVSAGELIRRSGLTQNELEELVSHGLLTESGGVFDGHSVAIATDARRLLAHGFEARHLRTIRHAVEREADILAQLTIALRRSQSPESHERARNVLAGGGEAMAAVHRALLAAELRALLEE